MMMKRYVFQFNPAKRKRYFNADNPQSKPTNNKSGSSGQEVIDLSNVDFSSFKSSNRRKKQKTSASQYKPMRKQVLLKLNMISLSVM